MDAPAHQFLVSSTFTAAPLEEPFRFWFRELRRQDSIAFHGYQQVFQTVLDPAGAFAANARGANVALFRTEDLGRRDSLAEIATNLNALGRAFRDGAARFAVPLLVGLCPESPGFVETDERQRFSSAMRQIVQEQLAGQSNLYLIDTNALIADYEVVQVYDPRSDRSGHVPYSNEFFVALATGIVRTVLSIERSPVKAIAVDCDNTLWSGVCGEDGAAGLVIGEGRRALQEFLLEQKRAGRLITLLSKNNERDVREVFAFHRSMPLQWSDVTAFRINWDQKSANVFQLAEELELGVDSFLVLDDDARECGELRGDCPEAITLQVPGREDELAHFTKHIWPLDNAKPATDEDLRRSYRYTEQAARKGYEAQATSFREFLAGLRLEIVFAPVTGQSLSRVAQLTQRTNQMHTSLERYTEAELARAMDTGMLAFTASVSDRFGSYGLVGAVFAREEGEDLLVTDLLLSCRALGRGVEHKMLSHAAEIAESRGRQRVGMVLKRGPRNRPAVDFVNTVFGPELAPEGELGTRVYAPVGLIKPLELQVSERAPRTPISSAERKAPAKRGESIDFERIATQLNSARKIEAEMDVLRRKNTPAERHIAHPPSTELEQKLHDVWCELLGLPAVGVDEDFFDLGGHSLLAVQLLSRIHQELGIDLPDAVIYGEKLRIASLARTIELQQLGVEDRGRYEAVLAEIDSLTDEEVEALLAQEELDLR